MLKSIPGKLKGGVFRNIPAVGYNAANHLRLRERDCERHDATHTEPEQKHTAAVDRISLLYVVDELNQTVVALFKLLRVRSSDVLDLVPRIAPRTLIEPEWSAGADNEQARIQVVRKFQKVVFIRAATVQQYQRRMFSANRCCRPPDFVNKR